MGTFLLSLSAFVHFYPSRLCNFLGKTISRPGLTCLLCQLLPCIKYFQYISRPENTAFKFWVCNRFSMTVEILHRPWVSVFCANSRLDCSHCLLGNRKRYIWNLCWSTQYSCTLTTLQPSLSQVLLSHCRSDALSSLHTKHDIICAVLDFRVVQREQFSGSYKGCLQADWLAGPLLL